MKKTIAMIAILTIPSIINSAVQTVKVPLNIAIFSNDYYVLVKSSQNTSVPGSGFEMRGFSITLDGNDIMIAGMCGAVPYMAWITTFTHIKHTLNSSAVFFNSDKVWGVAGSEIYDKYYQRKTNFYIDIIKYKNFDDIIRSNQDKFIEISTIPWASYKYIYGD